MARSLKYCFAIWVLFALTFNANAQISKDSLDQLLYEFDLTVVNNDSPTLQKLASELISLRDDVEDPNYNIQIWIVEAKLNIHLGDLDKAKICLNEAELKYKPNSTIISLNTQAEVYSAKSLLANFEGDYVKYESYLDTCLLTLKKEDHVNHTDVATVYQRLCYIYYGKGQVIKSIDYMRKAEHEMKQLDEMTKLDSLFLGNIFNDIAFLSNSTGNNDEVIPYYRQALIYNPTAWHIKLSLINNLRYEGDHKTAHLLTKEVIAEVGPDRPDAQAAAMLTMIAIIGTSEKYLFENPEEEMLLYAHKIVEIQKLLPATAYPYDASAFGVLCDYFRRVSKFRDLDKAVEYLKKMEALIAEKVKLNPSDPLISFNINVLNRNAQLDWVNKEYESATKHFSSLMIEYTGKEKPSSEEVQTIMLQKEEFKKVIIDYARMLMSKGSDQADGIEYLNKADEQYGIVDTVIDSLLSFNESKIEIDAIEELQNLGFGIALKQYEKTNDDQYLNIAYQRFEKLSTLMAFRHHKQSTLRYSNEKDSELKQQKNLLREELDILEGSVSENEVEQRNTEIKIDSLNKLFINLTEKLNVARSNYVNQSEKNKLASIEQLQSSMSEDELIYHAATDRITQEVYLLLITKKDVQSRIVIIESVRHRIEEVLASLSDPSSVNYKSKLKQLYTEFVQPFEDIIKDKKLVFVPTQDLALLPFGLFVDDQEQYLCFKNPILYKYSSSWQSDPDSNKKKGRKFISFAVPPTDSIVLDESRVGSNFLSAALKEVNLLKEQYGSELILEKNNPKEVFIDKSSEAKLLHVAVHSNMEPLNPIKSSLMLSSKDGNDQQLFYHEIDDLDLTADLVLLSSCQSGLGYPKSSGSVSSLARAFQLAGAKNLIQTTWSINDESTSSLMEIFYSKLEEGKEVSATLALAKREFLEQAPSKWHHPYYWGAFVLNGEDGVVTIPKLPFWKSPGFLIIIAILLGLLILFTSKRSKSEA